MKPDEQRMRDVLVDTIRLLCRTGVEYSRRLRVQGLLGITVDDEHVFLIHVDDCIARNCADVDDALCGYSDDCSTTSVSHLNSDFVDTDVDRKSHTVSEYAHSVVNTDQNELGAAAECSNNLSFYHQTQSDILTYTAVSEVSSVVAAADRAEDLRAVRMSSQSSSMENVQLNENILQTLNSKNCTEANQIASNGDMAAASDSAASINMSQSSVPNEMDAVNKYTLPAVSKMETDTEGDNNTNDVVLSGENHLGITTAADQSQHRPPNIEDVDSSSADTNEDVDSEHTSESEETLDHVAVPRLDLVSSLQFGPRGLVSNVSNWQFGGMQQQLPDGGADTRTVQPAVLTGVVQTGGSNVSVYYQQQILAAAAAAAHNRAARAAATSVKPMAATTELGSVLPHLPSAVKHKPPTTCTFQRRLPRRPRESEDKRFRCPFCELAYYHKKHLKYHLTKKHGF